MRKIYKSLIVLSFVLLFSFSANAETKNGHICSVNQCTACTVGEDGCNAGECSTNTCGVSTTLLPPIITNTEELKQTLNGQSLRLTGFGAPNSRVYIVIDTKDVNDSNVDSTGRFEVNFNPNLTTDDSHKIEVYLKDGSNNKSANSSPLLITVDKNIPDISFDNSDSTTNTATYLLKGTTKKGSKVLVLQNNKTIKITGSDENGKFAVNLVLDNGDNIFTIRVVDTSGNQADKDFKIKTTIDTGRKNSTENVLPIIILVILALGVVVLIGIFVFKKTQGGKKDIKDLLKDDGTETGKKVLDSDKEGNIMEIKPKKEF